MRYLLTISAFLAFSMVTWGQHWKEVALEGKELLDEANYQDAIQHFDSAKSLRGDAGLLDYNSGVAYYRLAASDTSLYDSASTRFTNSINYLPEGKRQAAAYHNLGNVHMIKGKYQDAVDAYKEALRRDPKNEKTRQNLLMALRHLPKNQQPNQGGKDDQQEKDQQEGDKEQKDQQGDKGDQQDQNGEKDPNDGKKDQQGDQGDQQKDDGQGSEQKPGQEKEGMSEQQADQLLKAQEKDESATRKAMMKRGKLDKEGKPIKGGSGGKDW